MFKQVLVVCCTLLVAFISAQNLLTCVPYKSCNETMPVIQGNFEIFYGDAQVIDAGGYARSYVIRKSMMVLPTTNNSSGSSSSGIAKRQSGSGGSLVAGSCAAPVEIGVVISRAAVEGVFLPENSSSASSSGIMASSQNASNLPAAEFDQYHISVPPQGFVSGIDHMLLAYDREGEEFAANLKDIPLFEAHFYLIPQAQVNRIVPSKFII